MKFYLFPLLLFVFLFYGNGFSFAQENLTEDSSFSNSESLPEYRLEKEHQDNSELQGVAVDRVERESDTFQAKFLNMLFILALLIGFMILASWALKRMMKTKITHLNTASTIKILETRYLSPRATLYLIEVQNRTLLIAESPTTVSYLTNFDQITDESSISSTIKT